MAISGRVASGPWFRRIDDWLTGLGETVAPSICMSCGGFAQRGWVCELCFATIRLWDVDWCSRCGIPADHGHARFCRVPLEIRRRKKTVVPAWNEIRALGVYDGILRTGCLTAKKADGSWIARSLAREWWHRHGAWAASLGRCVIVPIPRHWSRRLIEGHDPACSFAAALRAIWAESLGGREVRLVPLLKRTRATPRLAGLDPAERALVVASLFEVKKPKKREYEDDDRVVLVDDICTTGATAIAAAQACRNAGLRNLELAVIARTLEGLG
ncbi:hypothetical protein GC170_12820 [bacterium]|nr:hypothetical protein [bacterium]